MLRIELRLLPSLRDQRSDRVVQRDRTQARQIFDLKFEPARRTDAANGRRIEAERYGLGDLAEPCADVGNDLRPELVSPSLVPRFQNSKLDCCVRFVPRPSRN